MEPESPKGSVPGAVLAEDVDGSVNTGDEYGGQKSSKGSGFGGVWTAKDDFVARRRRTKWCRAPDTESKQGAFKPLPRVYVDNRTIIREVVDVCELRRGDHCLIAINLVRCLSPMMDYLVSFLGSLELVYFYHHFIMVDDVSVVDEQGIPRTKSGELAELVEYGNTIPEAFEEVRQASLGKRFQLPRIITRFLLDKSRCQRCTLADYGDTKHLYKVVENVTPQDRERIVGEALRVMEDPPKPYHIVFNNCEHISNHITRGRFTSPNMHFGMWFLCRTALCGLGLLCLHVVGGACYSRFCVSRPVAAYVLYHLLATVPVVLQALITFATVVRSVWRQYSASVISSDDFYHLFWKEFGRLIVAGGGAVVAIALLPEVAWQSRRFILTSVLCMVAYLASDMLYNSVAHAVMRLVLLPVWGKVWLIGPDERQAKKEA